jgi:hypothetical protein
VSETPQPVQPRSRRAILAGLIGGLGAVVASAVGKASPVRAEGEAMVVGGDYNTATSATILGNSTNTATVLLAQSTAGGVGVYGYSNSNIGTKGESVSGIGVRGISSSTYGVAGSSTSGTGVFGESSSSFGVTGVSTTSTGVSASSTSGYGLFALSTSNTGMIGLSNAGIGVNGIGVTSGVLGESNGGTGVYGVSHSADAAAVRTRNTGNGTGVIGVSGDTEPVAPVHTGVYGHASLDSASRGVWGFSAAGHGIHGESDTGWAGYFDGRMFTNGYFEMREIATPGSPALNRARIFVRDNGSGHTQLCVKFHNGVVRVLATS